MTRSLVRARLCAMLLSAAVLAGVNRDGRATVARAEASYAAVGTIVSISANRSVVHIAHRAIPGVMGAMTMSFEARTADAFAGRAPGDRVRFRFTVTDDGRRLIDALSLDAP